MDYSKPQVLAQNASQGSFAAGCPQDSTEDGKCSTIWDFPSCRACERSA